MCTACNENSLIVLRGTDSYSHTYETINYFPVPKKINFPLLQKKRRCCFLKRVASVLDFCLSSLFVSAKIGNDYFFGLSDLSFRVLIVFSAICCEYGIEIDIITFSLDLRYLIHSTMLYNITNSSQLLTTMLQKSFNRRSLLFVSKISKIQIIKSFKNK